MAADNRTAKKPNGFDNLFQKLNSLPPVVDLLIAATIGGYAFVAIYVDDAKLVGLACFLIALIFAMMGISSVMKEMKNFKIIEQKANLDALRDMKTAEFEKYLMSMFIMDGYKVRSGIDEFHRQDDADLIAVRKKETVMIQFNHWDEDKVDAKAIQSLHKAAGAFRATGALAVTLGQFTPEATAWATRKGVQLMTARDVIAMARRLTGQADETEDQSAETSVEATTNTVSDPVPPASRLLFVNFVGIEQGIAKLGELVDQHPLYRIVATKLPPLMTLDDAKRQLGNAADRLVNTIGSSPDGRYFAVQQYLLENGQSHANWLAIDAEPREFPEGCSELIAINRIFGFDDAAAHRVTEAIHFLERRVAQARTS